MNPVGGAGGGGSIDQIMALRRQIIDRSATLQELRQPQGAQGTIEAKAPTADFGNSLQSALDAVNASQTKAGDLSSAYERGETTDIAKVMLARQEAGVAFEATLQVRNKLLSAYQEIMRMGV